MQAGENDAAMKMLAFARRDSAENPVAPVKQIDAAVLALILGDKAHLQALAEEAVKDLGKFSGDAGRGRLFAILAACSDGTVALNAKQEQMIIQQLRLILDERRGSLMEGQIDLYAGQIALGKADWSRAASFFASAERFARVIGHVRLLCQALERVAAAQLERNKFRAARRASEECLELSYNAGLRDYETMAFERLIETEKRTSNWAKAYQLAERFLLRCEEGLEDPRRALRALETLETGQ